MTRRLLNFGPLLSTLLLAAGCTGTANRGVESVHQPVVSRTDYLFDVTAAGGALGSGERERLSGWMRSLRLGYGDRVAIDDPAGEGSAARDEIAAEVAGHGLLLSADTPVTSAPVAPGTLRVVVSRTTAAVPNCPDYSRRSENDLAQHTSSNYGCATNSNLAAMIARPEDLVRGQDGADTPDPARSARVIGAYRSAAPAAAPAAAAGK